MMFQLSTVRPQPREDYSQPFPEQTETAKSAYDYFGEFSSLRLFGNAYLKYLLDKFDETDEQLLSSEEYARYLLLEGKAKQIGTQYFIRQ